MSKKIFTSAALICIALFFAGCTKYEPDYTIWREVIITDYEIYEDYVDITVDDAYIAGAYDDVYYQDAWAVDEEADIVYDDKVSGKDTSEPDYQVYEAVCYSGLYNNDTLHYTIVSSQHTYTLDANEIDNFENMCDFIKESHNKILRLTIVNDKISTITETGYIVYGRT